VASGEILTVFFERTHKHLVATNRLKRVVHIPWDTDVEFTAVGSPRRESYPGTNPQSSEEVNFGARESEVPAFIC